MNSANAKYKCWMKGGLLATFDSTGQWHSVREVLAEIHDLNMPIWIDLHAMRSSAFGDDIYLRNMYANTWKWGDGGSVAYNFHSSFVQDSFRDLIGNKEGLSTVFARTWMSKESMDVFTSKAVCRSPPIADIGPTKPRENITIVSTIDMAVVSHVQHATCRQQHVTHVTLACDPQSLCSGSLERRRLSQTAVCKLVTTIAQMTTPYFRCGGQSGDYVPYSLVCDWRADCEDQSDESFCQFPPCRPDTFDCGQRQCINTKQKLDGYINCLTQRDEVYVGQKATVTTAFNVTYPPALVNLDRPGSFTLTALPKNSTQCPETHYKCPGNGYCLPIYTRCNGVSDCPGHEDEAGCDEYSCEGLYRCRGKDRQVCMHVKHLCDGWPQCPQHDDEVMCGVTESCPVQCVCYGTTFTELRVFQPETFPKLRYLEGRGSGLTLDVIVNQTMLIYLGAGACGWRNLSGLHLPNLVVFDIRDNHLQSIHFNQFSKLGNLKELDLSGNPLSSGLLGLDTRYRLDSLLVLNSSRVPSGNFHLTDLSDFLPKVQILDFSHSGLRALQGRGLFRNLKTLNMLGCSIHDFSPDFMNQMNDLQWVLADTFKLCCPALLPHRFGGQCIAPVDETSSCDNLLKSGFYRAALAIFTMTAVLGNLGSFVYRLWPSSAKRKVGYTVFVIHLSVSDFFMGVYLLIIGLADRSFAGSYLWKEYSWKRSTVCSTAGFLSLLSCEVSSLFICLITLDRFLVICFPFSRLRFGIVSAHVASIVTWVPGMILASIPLLPVTSHWAFYSQTGICIPLPVTRSNFPGRHYSFGVMIVFNMVIFLLIAAGQALIYWSVRVNTMPGRAPTGKDSVVTNDTTRSKETTVARRLLVIAMSDFLCWFPIGVCGLLSKLDIPIPGEVNIAMAIFVLPFNSALNPFLYTYTIMREKRRKTKEARLCKLIAAQVGTLNR